jgi:acetyltransferase-like isoleucine patch superfamily enzyme
LKLLGAKIGKGTIIHNLKFMNYYKHGFKKLIIGSFCFIGYECLFDLSDTIYLGDNVTVSDRVTMLTHLNVGFKDHPLQKYFPASTKGIVIKDGVFVGINTTILPGVLIGEESFIGACSLVNEAVEPKSLVAGIPARLIRKIT